MSCHVRKVSGINCFLREHLPQRHHSFYLVMFLSGSGFCELLSVFVFSKLTSADEMAWPRGCVSLGEGSGGLVLREACFSSRVARVFHVSMVSAGGSGCRGAVVVLLSYFSPFISLVVASGVCCLLVRGRLHGICNTTYPAPFFFPYSSFLSL